MPVVSRGLNFDGSCAHLTIGKTEIPFISFSYGDNLKAEWVYRAGSQIPDADTPGQYETEEGSLKLSSVRARADLFPFLPQFGGGVQLLSAVVTYAQSSIGRDSDLLQGFRIMGNKASIEAGSKGLECELKVRYRIVRWTEKRICWAAQTGANPSGRIRL